jgi:hypothetical protein
MQVAQKLWEKGENFQQTTNRMLGSGYSLKIFSVLEDACVAANAFSGEEFENGMTNAENVNMLLLRSCILSCK